MNPQTTPLADDPRIVFDAVVACVGSQAALASALGVTQQAVSWWRKSGRFPDRYCADIERVTGGRVDRRVLRPNDWYRIWPELAEISKQKPAQALDGQALGAMAGGVA